MQVTDYFRVMKSWESKTGWICG